MREVVIVGLVGFVFLALLSGLSSVRRSLTAGEFFLLYGKLQLGPFIGTMTATNLSLGNMIFVCAIWGYLYGWSGLFWVTVCIVLLLVGFHLLRTRFNAYIEDRANDGSVHEYISQLFAESRGTDAPVRLRITAALATVIASC